jgi:hypothetical protein
VLALLVFPSVFVLVDQDTKASLLSRGQAEKREGRASRRPAAERKRGGGREKKRKDTRTADEKTREETHSTGEATWRLL